MDTLTAARAQMEVSLAFHMIFAALGIGMPLLMVLAEWRALRTGEPHWRHLARKWAKATALTFAVGAVSGTALSFELGLLWPRFMAFSGGIIGPAFALEGYAFFIEAIFLGLYLYGWERLSPRAHLWAGVAVAFSGMMSGVLVVAANAWMQNPVGFTLGADGQLADVNPLAPFMSPAWFQMSLHSTLSCYIATAFAAAGVYAVGLLRGRRDAYHRGALSLALAVGTVTALLQPLSGDLSAKHVAEHQPAKLAAMEAHFETERRADLIIGGIPDAETGEVAGAIRIPGLLSFMAFGDFDAEVRGLSSFPEDERPNVLITHLAFQVMVGSGLALIGLGLWFWLMRWRKREPGIWMLRAVVVASPLGFLALQAGWIVTEVGRQPWIVYGVMRTRDGVTPVADVPLTLFGFSLLYLGLGIALAYLLRRLATGAPRSASTTAQTDAAEVAHAR
jgi:cytochrome bd ubiquinol oxidase subunit I